MLRTINHFIDGKEYEGIAGRTGPVYDPSTGEVTAQVAFAGADVVDVAVRAARQAFESWRHSPLSERVRILFAFRSLVHRRREELSRIVTAEHGKVLADPHGEVARGLEVVDFVCGIPHLLKG